MKAVPDTGPGGGASTARSGEAWPPARLAWGAVAILALAQSVNAIDRHIINLLVGPIKADLKISDTQVGLLLGFAFALFYTFVGLPIGRWADSYSRRLIIALGAVVWSVMTIACGLTRSFGQLFAARMGVGAGEATLNPSGYSLISDYFPAERRAGPLGLFIAGHTVGAAFALMVGGAFLQQLIAHHVVWPSPLGGTLNPWQIAFLCAGLPGFAVALLVLAIREPPRREMIAGADGLGPPRGLPLKTVAAYLAAHRKAYLPIFAGFGLILVWEIGRQLWTPTYFMRTFGWTHAQVGLRLGLMTLIFQSGGALASGWASDLLARRGCRDASLRAAFVGTLVGLPFAVLASLAPTPALATAASCPVLFFGAFPFALAPAAIAAITPNQARAQVTALYLFTINLLGFGLGPMFIGAITDHVFGDERLLRFSLSVAAAITLPPALVCLRLSMPRFVRALDARPLPAAA